MTTASQSLIDMDFIKSLGFSEEEGTLESFVLRTPKFKVRLDPWGRLYLSRKRWNGEFSFWMEVVYSGKEELKMFVKKWIED
jgi:hypothetical protein